VIEATTINEGVLIVGNWTQAPDGSYVGGSEWTVAPDGTYVGGPSGCKFQMERMSVVVAGSWHQTVST